MNTQKMAIVPFDLLKRISTEGLTRVTAPEIRALLAAPGNTTMGVGDGSGRLFVHGDYDSIKAMQAIILERDALRAQLDRSAVQLPAKTPAPKHLLNLVEETTRQSRNATIDEVAALNDRPAGCCCPPPGHTGIWGAGMCPVHQGLRRVL